ncbi:Lysozyme M1 precursor [Corynebacterium capitovis DSM 44611]|uniref:glycoside hydrolase family 25 protein n=1 Tax=Corynebacterium capitovis TaxID=131081 RepID=UPI0003A474FB|nr:glycoside hydrolase family 25 protein [Corynebacterium capitovis]WKD57822.1 Lysozyme M1 precursor [Corynebacterium capitovis DSM 44611]
MHTTRRRQTITAAVASLSAAVMTFGLAAVVPFSPAHRTSADAQSITDLIPGMVQGVDVAGYQRPGGQQINWAQVAGAGSQDFAFVKATEGEGWTNEFYEEDAQQAGTAGLAVGAYHYARPAHDPVVQAQHFASVINSGPALSLPPVLDLEVDEGLSPAALSTWTASFLTEVERLTGEKPMLYTYRYFWYERMGNTTAFSEYPLWLAAFQNVAPRPVGGWDKVSIWQRSSDGSVPGVSAPVDLNIFNGDGTAFTQFVGGNLTAGGGVLESFQATDDGVAPGLDVLEQNSTALVVAILGLATGILNSPQISQAAQQLGFAEPDSAAIADEVRELADSGRLPVDDLRTMMLGDYSVGDLLILLNNIRTAA